MSLETVVEDVREEARSRAEEITEAAQQEADEIVTEAEDDAEEIRRERERQVEREIEQEREQRLSSAKLSAKQERLEARREVLSDVRERVEDELATLEDGREELTRALFEDAATEFDGDATVEVYSREDDQELVESILADDENYEYAGSTDILGGVVAESTGSRVRVKNTFDSVLADVWEDNLREVSERLFEDQ